MFPLTYSKVDESFYFASLKCCELCAAFSNFSLQVNLQVLQNDFFYFIVTFSSTVSRPDIVYSEFNFMGCLDDEVMFSHTLHLDSLVSLSPFSPFCLRPSEAIK